MNWRADKREIDSQLRQAEGNLKYQESPGSVSGTVFDLHEAQSPGFVGFQ